MGAEDHPDVLMLANISSDELVTRLVENTDEEVTMLHTDWICCSS